MSFVKPIVAKYKDLQGRYRTESLFFERYRNPIETAKYPPIWTLRENDYTAESGVTYPSLLQVYLAANDPTEYNFAMDTFGSYEHWKRLCESWWFKPLVETWRETLEVKIQADGIKKMMENTDYLKAAQWMAEKGWKDKKAAKTKVTKQQLTRAEAQVRNDIDDDASRLGIETKD